MINISYSLKEQFLKLKQQVFIKHINAVILNNNCLISISNGTLGLFENDCLSLGFKTLIKIVKQ